MKNLIKTSITFLYIFFAQVYPIVHWHPDEHQDDMELRLSVHPPDFPVDDHNHQHPDEHEHDDSHFVGNWDYTIQSNTFDLNLAEKHFVKYESFTYESQVLNRKPQDIPLKLPRHFLSKFLLNRAPPNTCL